MTYGDVSSGTSERNKAFRALFLPQNRNFAEGRNYVGISTISYSGSQSRVESHKTITGLAHKSHERSNPSPKITHHPSPGHLHSSNDGNKSNTFVSQNKYYYITTKTFIVSRNISFHLPLPSCLTIILLKLLAPTLPHQTLQRSIHPESTVLRSVRPILISGTCLKWR